ncbi:hypothetical protein PIB30_051428, partial [Stylosanthes scabra]|nr:hypothetical protein [Stylosanthes scabra]
VLHENLSHLAPRPTGEASDADAQAKLRQLLHLTRTHFKETVHPSTVPAPNANTTSGEVNDYATACVDGSGGVGLNPTLCPTKGSENKFLTLRLGSLPVEVLRKALTPAGCLNRLNTLGLRNP